MITALLVLQALTLLAVGFLAVRAEKQRPLNADPDREASPTAALPPDVLAPVLDAIRVVQSDVVESRQSLVGTVERNAAETATAVRAAAEQTDQTLRESLDRELRRDQGNEWVQAAGDLSDGEALDLLEAGAARHPGSLALINRLLEVYAPLAKEEDEVATRRFAVLRLNEHLDRFRLACRREHLPLVKAMRLTVDRLAEEVVGEVQAQYQGQLDEQLHALEEGVDHVVRDPEADVALLEELDRAVDQEGLRQYPELKARYDDASRRLVHALRDRDTSVGGDDSDYNCRAMEAAKRAWERFHANEKSGVMGAFKDKDFNDPEELRQMVEDLGGWDSRRLLPATNTYVTSIYSEVFQKLKPEGRARLTELMIKASTQE